MIDLHLSAFAPRWRFLYVVRIDAYVCLHLPSPKLLTITIQTAGQAFMACPAAFSARIESVFLVYGGASVEPPPMLYSSSSSDHEEIM